MSEPAAVRVPPDLGAVLSEHASAPQQLWGPSCRPVSAAVTALLRASQGTPEIRKTL